MTKIRQYKGWHIYQLNKTEAEEWGFGFAVLKEYDSYTPCLVLTYLKGLSVKHAMRWIDENGRKHNLERPELVTKTRLAEEKAKEEKRQKEHEEAMQRIREKNEYESKMLDYKLKHKERPLHTRAFSELFLMYLFRR